MPRKTAAQISAEAAAASATQAAAEAEAANQSATQAKASAEEATKAAERAASTATPVSAPPPPSTVVSNGVDAAREYAAIRATLRTFYEPV